MPLRWVLEEGGAPGGGECESTYQPRVHRSGRCFPHRLYAKTPVPEAGVVHVARSIVTGTHGGIMGVPVVLAADEVESRCGEGPRTVVGYQGQTTPARHLVVRPGNRRILERVILYHPRPAENPDPEGDAVTLEKQMVRNGGRLL